VSPSSSGVTPKNLQSPPQGRRPHLLGIGEARGSSFLFFSTGLGGVSLGGLAPHLSGKTVVSLHHLKRFDLLPGVDVAEVAHPVPDGLKAGGRRLWESTVGGFVLEEHELGLLQEACRTADACDDLQAVVDADGVLNSSSQGVRAHPALVELRHQRICLARLVAQLGLPTGDEEAEDGASRQRRAARGVYGIRGIVS
jgi:hypothetical protein